MRDKLLARLRPLRRRMEGHAGWLWGGGFAVVVLACAIAVGVAAHSRAAAAGERVQRAERSLAYFDEWSRAFQPATAAESTAWLETEQAVRELGLTLATRVALAELVARRAEEIGVPNVRVSAVATDSIAFAPVTSGVWRFDLSPLGYLVELTGDAAAVSELLRVLPPHVEARHVSIAPGREGMNAKIQLIAYRIANEAEL